MLEQFVFIPECPGGIAVLLELWQGKSDEGQGCVVVG